MTALKKRALGIALLLLSLAIVAVSAYVYETANINVTQTVKNIATLTVQNSALGNIEEGQTITYTKATVSSLGSILNLTTTKDNVYLHFNSDLDSLTAYYSNYTMTLAAPDPAGITLDKTGAWSFDFEITTTAKSVSADQATTVTIVVTAEST